MEYKVELIEQIRLIAGECALENSQLPGGYSLPELALIFNGIGSDKMPAILRNLIGKFNRPLLPAVLIHDLEFYEGGDKEKFHDSNRRFQRNGIKLAQFHYSKYDFRRYFMTLKVVFFARLCQLFGRSAWNLKTEAANHE